MNKRLALAAAAAISLVAGSTLAQPASPPPGSADPGKSPATSAAPPSDPGASSAASASSAGANASVTTGMTVKDSSGAAIGKITDVKTGADGKQTATIKMGADTFAVDTASLAVSGDAATVNASQDEIKKMLKK